MEFLQAILPGLIAMCIVILLFIIGNYIWYYRFIKRLDADLLAHNLTPPKRDWLFREKQ